MNVFWQDMTGCGFTINTGSVSMNGRVVFETVVRHSLFRNGMWIVLGQIPNDKTLAMQFHNQVVELFEKNGQHVHRLRDFINGKTYVRQKERKERKERMVKFSA